MATSTVDKKDQPTTSNHHNNKSGHVQPLTETDPKAAKDKQAQEKLELMEMYRAIQNGKLPHNDKLDEMLEKMMNNTVVSSREHKMSPDGKLLLKDFRHLLQTLRNALRHKNGDELFQSYVHHLYLMESPIKKDHITGSVDQSHKDATQEEGKKNYQALVRIGKLLVLNNEFRSLLGEIIDLSQSVFSNMTGSLSDSLKTASDNVQETGDNHGRSGKEYVDDLLIGDRQKHGQEEPHLIHSRAQDPQHTGLLNTGDSVHPDLLPMNQHQTNPLSLHDQTTNQNTLANRNIERNDTELSQPYYDTAAGTYEEGKNNFKETAKKHADKHKETFTTSVKEHFSKDKQDELLDRLRRAVAQVQSHPDYQEATNTIIDICQNWTERISSITGDVKEKSKQQDEQAELRRTSNRELKTIIETWGQGKSIDHILHALRDVKNDAKEDQELRDYYKTSLHYVKRLINEPNYVNREESTRDGRELTERGKRLMKGKYGDHYNLLSKLVRDYLKIMAEDETAREINQCITKIHQDLWMDSDGNPAFKPHLLNDMRMTLLPAFLDELRYIPVPRVEYSDKQYDVMVDNLVISGDALIPNIFETKMENFYSFNLRSDDDDDNNTKHSRQSLFIRMSEIQAKIDDVAFSYKKKTGFPKLSDNGIASVYVVGKGITVTLRIQNATDPDHTFKVSNLKCNVDNIKINVSESKHDILYKAVRPIVTGMIKKQIAKAIENKIALGLESLDRRITTSIVNMNQSLQEKAYNALPESEKDNLDLPTAMAREGGKPGFFSTVVTIINRNIKTKVENHNINKREKSLRRSSTPSKRRSFFSMDRKTTPSESSKQRDNTTTPETSDLNIHHNEPGFSSRINEDNEHQHIGGGVGGSGRVEDREPLNIHNNNNRNTPQVPDLNETGRPSVNIPGESLESHNSLPGSFPVNGGHKKHHLNMANELSETQQAPPTATHLNREGGSQQL